MKKITKTEFLKLLSTQREFVELDCRNFKLNNLTLANKNFEKCVFSTIVNCTFNDCEFDECTFDNAFISECSFDNTSIEYSDLTDATFIECTFKQSSLNNSKLYCADLSQCTLNDTSLHDANCTNAAFRECNFNAMKYDECTCNFALNCPEKGSFTAFKKAYLNDGTLAIVELRVPADALRSSATTRKCRVSKAKRRNLRKQRNTTRQFIKTNKGPRGLNFALRYLYKDVKNTDDVVKAAWETVPDFSKLSQVKKITKANSAPVTKLSDHQGKLMCTAF